MKLSRFLAALLALSTWIGVAQAQVQINIANEGSTGTAVGKLAKLTGAPATAIITTAGDTGGAVGIVTGWSCPAGTGGNPTATTCNAVIARSGIAACTFDGATTADHYVGISASVNGDCTDVGSTFPTSGQILGRVLTTNASGGTYAMTVAGPEIQGIIGATFANPTGTAGNTAVNGSATTAMRSDGAPPVGPTALPTPGSGATLVAARSYYVCTTTCSVTPPVPAAGDEFCVINDDNVSTVITIANPGTGTLFEKTARTGYGTATTGTMTSGGAVGDKVCIVGRDTTHYLIGSFTGTWTNS